MKFYPFLVLVLACGPSVEPEAAPTEVQTETVEDPKPLVLTEEGQQARDAMVSAIGACTEDESCMASIVADDELLGSCPWYEAVGCSTVVAAAVAVCVDPETMELCDPALEAVKAIGCCDCLPKGWVRDACKQI